MTKRAIVVALLLTAATANAQPSPAPIGEPPAPPMEASPASVGEPPAAQTEEQVPPTEAPRARENEDQAPGCVAGARWYVETSFFAGSVRYRSESADSPVYSGSAARYALSAATGVMYRACSDAETPGLHVRLGAYFEVREQLPIGAEAQVDVPSGGYRIGGRIAVTKTFDNYPYAPWETAVGFRARHGILLFGVDGVYSRYTSPYVGGSSGSSYGVLVGIGIQARPDAD